MKVLIRATLTIKTIFFLLSPIKVNIGSSSLVYGRFVMTAYEASLKSARKHRMFFSHSQMHDIANLTRSK